MLLAGLAYAAPPFEAGPLEPLPMVANDVAILNGELLVLADDGVYTHTETGWDSTGVSGGKRFAVLPDVGVVICGPDGVRRYTLEEERLSDLPCSDIAKVPEGYWVLNDDGVFLVPGDTPVPLDGAIALGGGPEHAWVAGNRLHINDEERLVFPGATDLERLQRQNTTEWVLVHPERSLLGILGASGLESAWPQPIAATAVAIGDLGRDGVRDIVLVGRDGWVALTDGRVQPPPKPDFNKPPPLPSTLPPVSRRPRPRRQTLNVLGLRLPKFAGLDPDPDYDSMFVGGFGLAIGRALGPSTLAIGFSPGAVGGIERGTRRLRYYLGADSAPLFSWAGDAFGIHLAMATVGASLGSDRLRAGPFVSVGLLGVGAGVRAVFTPFSSRSGKLTGFEGRLTWFYPNAGHASLYYVSAFPMGRRGRPASDRTPRASLCRRFQVGLGVAGGFSSTAYAWDFVGRDRPFQTSWSPALVLACESGSKQAGWVIGGESAPFFFYRVPTLDQGADRRLHHLGSMTLGLFLGGDRVRFGPIATAGIWTLGGGFRAVLTPFRTPGGVYHGLELRAVALYPSSPAGQAMAIYTVSFDPKIRRARAVE